MDNIKIEKQGRRYYLVGNTYTIKEDIKDSGGHWDPDVGAWWTSKREVAESLVAKAAQEEAALPEATGPMVAIQGNTYPVKDELKKLGARWNGAKKVWEIAQSRHALALKLVPAAKPKAPRKRRSSGDGSVSRREEMYRRRYGWDGVYGSASYYSSGAYDEFS